MAFVINDRVKETTSTTGTGTVTLSGAATGFQSFSSGIGSSNSTYYTIALGNQFEVGIGTLTNATTFTRDSVITSSNTNTLVNFSAGTKDIFCTLPASKAIVLNTSSQIDVTGDTFITTSDGNITLTPNGTGKVSLSSILYPNADGTANQFLKTNGSGTLSFATVLGSAAWQAVKTTNFTVTAGEGYFVNTSSAAITATLPASPTLGDFVSFIDYDATFDTNNLTVARNGKNIQGVAEDLTVAVERAGFTLVFTDNTEGWLLQNK
jgi:hypothetical protein